MTFHSKAKSKQEKMLWNYKYRTKTTINLIFLRNAGIYQWSIILTNFNNENRYRPPILEADYINQALFIDPTKPVLLTTKPLETTQNLIFGRHLRKIGIYFGNWPIANFFDDQTIFIKDCELYTIGRSLKEWKDLKLK